MQLASSQMYSPEVTPSKSLTEGFFFLDVSSKTDVIGKEHLLWPQVLKQRLLTFLAVMAIPLFNIMCLPYYLVSINYKKSQGRAPLICTCLFADLDSEKDLLNCGVLLHGLFSPSFSLSSAWGNIKSVFREFITGKCLILCKQGRNKEKICCFVDLDLGQMYFCLS